MHYLIHSFPWYQFISPIIFKFRAELDSKSYHKRRNKDFQWHRFWSITCSWQMLQIIFVSISSSFTRTEFLSLSISDSKSFSLFDLSPVISILRFFPTSETNFLKIFLQKKNKISTDFKPFFLISSQNLTFNVEVFFDKISNCSFCCFRGLELS